MKPAAAIYLRVSKDDGSQTTDNQRPDVEQMAAGRGYEVAPEHVYIDDVSGAKGADARPALDAMLAAAARGRFKALIVWRLDRLSRDDTFYGGALIVADLDRYNVGVLSHQQTWIDTTGPLRNVFVQFAFALAADERATLIKRTKAGLARARAAGKRLGRRPAAVTDAVLIRAESLYAEHASWRTVARALRLEGVQGLPSYATIARLCKARTKTGGCANAVAAVPPGVLRGDSAR